MTVDVRDLGQQAATTARELGGQAATSARDLGEQAVDVAAVAWEAAHEIVGELVERSRDLDLPEPVERAADAIRRRPSPFVVLVVLIIAVFVGRAVWRRYFSAPSAGTDRSVGDPYPGASYQPRAEAAAS